jgi:4-amino-4-deoxy-L-arabinose transferase-like glycosyltransferase
LYFDRISGSIIFDKLESIKTNWEIIKVHLTIFNRQNYRLMKNLPKILIIALFLILAIVQADKKFVLDELDFPIVAKATSETGVPIYYRGEDNPNHIGIYHPTLYINTLALFIKIFGYNENVIRTFGMLCILITALIIIYIYREIFEKTSKTFEIVFLGLFLLNPYTIANSTLPDIDSTVLPITMSLFFFYSIKIFKNNNEHLQGQNIFKNGVLVISIIFSLCLWTKLTTPIILPIFLIPLLFTIGKSIKDSVILSGIISFIGGLIFLITYWIYCKLLNLPYGYTFKFLLDSFTKGTSGESRIDKIIGNLSYTKHFVHWLTIPTTFLILFSICYLILKAQKRQDWMVIILGLFGLFVSVFYLGLISPFGGFFKYPFPVFAFLLMPISIICSDLFTIEDTKTTYLAVFILTIIFTSFVYTDIVFLERRAFQLTFPLIILAVTLSIILVKVKRPKFTLSLILTLLFFSLSSSLGISRYQAISNYPTKYYYGQAGMEDAITYLKGRVKEDELVWSMKDIGYYVNNRYVENYSYFFDKKLQEKLILMTKDTKIRYYVTTVGIGEDRLDAYPEIREILDSNCQHNYPKTFGNFVIYNCGQDNE